MATQADKKRLNDGTGIDEVRAGGVALTPSAVLTRPADTTAYAIGDQMGAAALVFSIADGDRGGGVVRRARCRKSTNTTANANIRLHLFNSLPTVSVADNAPIALTATAGYLGYIDFTSFDQVWTDFTHARGIPAVGQDITFAGGTIWGVPEARAAYAPGNAEAFTFTLEILG